MTYRTLPRALTALFPILLATAACDDAAQPVSEVPVNPDDKGAAKADQWGAQDAPTIFTPDLKLVVTDLPLQGEAVNIPWAGNYWPTYEDSINVRWDGASSDSPAAKYGKAFNIADLENKISVNYGIDKYKTRTACKQDSECNSKIGEGCAKRHGQESGFCIPTWWGICHAWAPAAVLEPEPVHPVTRNGVTFKVNDIKALVTLVYNSSTSKFVSLRCNKDEAQDQIKYDAYGRPLDTECKDTNPGTYHVLLTNYLGLRGQAFVEDRTFDDEVWNQPLRGYRITQQREVTAQDANKLVGVTAAPGTIKTETFGLNAVASNTWHHQAAYTVVPGTTVKVVLSGTKDADLYVRQGSQPTEQAYDCRPYEATSNETCELQIRPGVTQLFVSVHVFEGPADVSVKADIPTQLSEVPTTYLFNDKATKFYHVKLEVDYISESNGSTDGNLSGTINTYTRTDRYEYVLEVDKDGKVNGGEWIGSSKRNHPDFLWLPTGRSSTPIAGGAITYANVKSLLEESVASPNGGNASAQTAVVEEATKVGVRAWKHFGPYSDVGSGFTVAMTGTGDADLYVRKGAQPTDKLYDCRPYAGNSTENCAVDGAGSFYVSVYGYRESEVRLSIRYVKAGSSTTTPPPTPAVQHLSIDSQVALGAIASYSLPVVAGKKIVIRTQAPNDVDLYVRMTLAPTVNVYDQRGYTNSGNETVTVTPSQNGILHIGVHGYKASTFKLTTADN